MAMDRKIFKTHDHKGVFSLFGYRQLIPGTVGNAGFALISGFFLIGCGGDQTRDEPMPEYYTDQSSAVFTGDSSSSGTTVDTGGSVDVSALLDGEQPDEALGNADDAVGGWSIVLTKLSNTSMERAQQLLRVIQSEAGLRQAFIEQRSDGLVIAYGNYIGREEATKDLDRVRQTRMMSSTPFANAIITPPSSNELRGSNAMHDLRTVKERYGQQAVYTLQIGVYGRADYQSPGVEELTAYREAAEEAVRQLRSQGETAFYYHAPARSMVTIGVFGEKDFDSSTLPPIQSPMLKRTREKFPHNLLNGAGINETIRTESGKTKILQSSQLVAIPEK
jgi:hypothetical protein